MLMKANTIGLFQLESGGMRDLCRRIGIDSIEVINALIALYRPGPMQFIDDYIARKHGKVKVEYDHPALEPILKETYGIFVYQEQVMQAANDHFFTYREFCKWNPCVCYMFAAGKRIPMWTDLRVFQDGAHAFFQLG